MNIFRQNGRAVAGQRNMESDFLTMATLPPCFHEVLQEEAKKEGKTEKELQQELLTDAVKRELAGEEV